jgi:hypothetical protein
MIIGVLALFAPPSQPAPRPEIILIQARPEPAPDGGLGCLPLFLCAIVILLIASAL